MLQNIILPVLGAALVPMVIGFIWYNPKVFGGIWMEASGMTEEKAKGANMPVIFGVSFLLSVFLTVATASLTIHQMHVGSIFQGDTTVEGKAALESFMTAYGDRFRTFGHGVLHGFISAIFIVLPILGTNALFERKGVKYILVNVGYWAVTLMLMGGILCQFLKLG